MFSMSSRKLKNRACTKYVDSISSNKKKKKKKKEEEEEKEEKSEGEEAESGFEN